VAPNYGAKRIQLFDACMPECYKYPMLYMEL